MIWDEQEITKRINACMKEMETDYFPSYSELNKFYGNKGLSVAISRRGGWKYWASKMGLPLKRSETKFGDEYELIALKEIKVHTGFEGYQTSIKHPYDLLINNNIKVDVKVARFTTDKVGTSINTFNMQKKEPTCDLFIFYCLDENMNVRKRLIIPSCFVSGKVTLSVGVLSKWDNFNEQWQYFEIYNKFYNELLGSNTTLPRRRYK